MADEMTGSAMVRQAAEIILEDESLTADLEDDEADALLHWALAAAEQAVAVRRQRGEPLDMAAIADAMRPVRQVTRAVNDLAARRTELTPHDFLVHLLALIDAACQLTPGAVAIGSPVTGPPSSPVPPS